jgi:formate dehydrogenase major subunit
VSWDEAIAHAASEFKRIQAEHGRGAIGGITSSRCTNEETFLVQKLVRAGFGNNNVDTCARVCHSPTGYGLKPPSAPRPARRTSTRSSSRRDPGDRRQPDRRPPGVRLAHESAAAPGREADRRSTRAASTWCAAPHVEAAHHLPLRPAPTSPCSTRWRT